MGIELLFGIGLGFLVLGPKRMHEMLGHLGRAKARFDKASREIKAQLAAELGKETAAGDSPPFAGEKGDIPAKAESEAPSGLRSLPAEFKQGDGLAGEGELQLDRIVVILDPAG